MCVLSLALIPMDTGLAIVPQMINGLTDFDVNESDVDNMQLLKHTHTQDAHSEG